MPVRPYTYRQRKYKGKIDPDVVRTRFVALKDLMFEQTEAKFSDLETMENQVKSICEAAGVPTITIPFYLNYGRELYKKSLKFTGLSLQNEADLIADKWQARGLDRAVLVDIAAAFGITIPAY